MVSPNAAAVARRQIMATQAGDKEWGTPVPATTPDTVPFTVKRGSPSGNMGKAGGKGFKWIFMHGIYEPIS